MMAQKRHRLSSEASKHLATWHQTQYQVAALSPNPELVQMIGLYYDLPESKRRAFIVLMSATIAVLQKRVAPTLV
jgi:hypothetical protein